jgi:hypothetical protein
VGGTARPNATATPRSENILRRETISHSILSIIFDLLGLHDNGSNRHSRIPGDSRAKIALSGVFGNGKSRSRTWRAFFRTLTHAGGARSRAISDWMSVNICRDSATSAIWNVTQRP